MVAGLVATSMVAAGFALIATSPAAKASQSGTIRVFAGGVGEGRGFEVAGIVTAVHANDAEILSGNPTRAVLRALNRSNDMSTVRAGNGAGGGSLLNQNSTYDARSVPLGIQDIDRFGDDIYASTQASIGIVKVANGLVTPIVPGVNSDGIELAPDGTIYWTEANRVRRRLPDGTIQLVAGSTTAGYAEGSSRVDLQACKLEYSIVSPK